MASVKYKSSPCIGQQNKVDAMALPYYVQLRQMNYDRFLDTIVSLSGLPVEDAKKAYATLLKHKGIKVNSVTGEVTVKHGAFMDKQVLLRAAQPASAW
jgi:transcription initiation factor TFIIIB Brf1 subunit/transcription initiation factor TFIIB